MNTFSGELTITLRGPLHVGTGTGLAQLVDEQTVRARTAFGARAVPHVPASSLRGRLRWHLSDLAAALNRQVCTLDLSAPGGRDRLQSRICKLNDPCPACLLFGAPDQEGALWLADAHLTGTALTWAAQPEDMGGPPQDQFLTGPRHFVGLSRQRRVARPQLLATVEQITSGHQFTTLARADFPGPAGAWLDLPDGRRVPQALALLLAATRAVTHLGGHKARGLGRVALAWSDLRWDGQPLDEVTVLEALRNSLPEEAAR